MRDGVPHHFAGRLEPDSEPHLLERRAELRLRVLAMRELDTRRLPQSIEQRAAPLNHQHAALALDQRHRASHPQRRSPRRDHGELIHTPQRMSKPWLLSFSPKPGEIRKVQPEGIFQARTGAR